MMKFDTQTTLIRFILHCSIILPLLVCSGTGLCGQESKKPKPLETQRPDNDENEQASKNRDLANALGDDMIEKMSRTVRRCAFSKDEQVALRAFKLFARRPGYHQKLGEGDQLELVNKGLESDQLQIFALTILESSEIQDTERHSLFLDFYKSSNPSVSQRALREINSNREQYLQRLISELTTNPLADHKTAFQLIELWGPQAKAALPALIKIYNARKEKAKQSNRPFDYLDILIAVGEIGSESSQAGVQLILDACNEKNDERGSKYVHAGLMSLERVADGRNISVGPIEYNATGVKYAKYGDSLFETYDKNKDGMLSNEETKKMRRPPVGADLNGDGQVSKPELVQSLAGNTEVLVKNSARWSGPSIRREVIGNK